ADSIPSTRHSDLTTRCSKSCVRPFPVTDRSASIHDRHGSPSSSGHPLDVDGAGGAVDVDALEDGCLVPVHHQRVAESRRSAAHEVLIVKAEPSPTVLVVFEAGIELQVFVGPLQE